MESTQLSVSSGTNTVAAYHRQATDVAGVCKDIVHQTAQSIGGRKYVRVEGWQAIATALTAAWPRPETWRRSRAAGALSVK
jgi:hypothetical protein